MFAIIDIETTGGNAAYDRITDISIILHDGLAITETFNTLINPERKIPYYITQLTGISNEMVAEAPKFFEIAKKIIDLTEGMIFVAHNVSFDYNFVVQEFKSLGYTYKRDKLCTVKLSRKLIPNKPSYSLGKLCEQLGIKIEDRHRAHGDALATAKLFEILLSVKNEHSLFQKQDLNYLNKSSIDDIKTNIIKKLPEETGVYYLLDKSNRIIYIGKSKQIRQRAFSHLNSKTQKAQKIINSLCDVDFILTGSELIALLLESQEIKNHLPEHNRAQKQHIYTHFLTWHEDERGLINYTISNGSNAQNTLISFSNDNTAKEKLNELIDQHELCLNHTTNQHNEEACFNYQIKKCKGICAGLESIDDYNKRARKLKASYEFENKNFAIMDQGRSETENSFILIIDGKYGGYGYFENDESINSFDELKERVQDFTYFPESHSIIKQYLKANPRLKILKS